MGRIKYPHIFAIIIIACMIAVPPPARGAEPMPGADSSLYADGPPLWEDSLLTPGSIRFSLGPGKYRSVADSIWNPDFIRPVLELDPIKRGRGLDSAQISYAIDEKSEISTSYTIDGDFESRAENNLRPAGGDYRVKVETHVNILDLAIHYAESKKEHTDYQGEERGEDVDNLVVPVKWRLLSAGLRGEIGGVGIRAEGGHTWLSVEDDTLPINQEEEYGKDHSSFLVGVDYTFQNELYLVLEYIREGLGKDSPEDYTTKDRLAYEAGERATLGKNNLFLGAKYPIAEMTSLEVYNIINANDPSVKLNPWIVWSATDDLTVSLSAEIPIGKEDTSLGKAVPKAFGSIQLNF